MIQLGDCVEVDVPASKMAPMHISVDDPDGEVRPLPGDEPPNGLLPPLLPRPPLTSPMLKSAEPMEYAWPPKLNEIFGFAAHCEGQRRKNRSRTCGIHVISLVLTPKSLRSCTVSRASEPTDAPEMAA